jgi:hypothetical protein
LAPDHDQSEKAIKNWLKSHVAVGTIVAIKRSQDGTVLFERGKVLSIRPKNFNVGPQQEDGSFADAGITFDYAGRSWRENNDDMRLVIPTEAVLKACGVV